MYEELDGPKVRAMRESDEAYAGEFAERTVITSPTLCRVERNEEPVTVPTARKIAALQVESPQALGLPR